MFHVSQLKAVIGKHYLVLPLPEVSAAEEEFVITPENILDSRYSGSRQLEVLVQWVGIPATEATWVSIKEFHAQLPSYQLEGKLSVKGEGIDKLDRVYVRHGTEQKDR